MRTLSYAFLFIAFIGFADSMYLSLSTFFGTSLSCGILDGCNTVAKSEYSRLWGIPLAYLGVLYYAGAIFLGGYIGSGVRFFERLVFPYATVGLLMSLWFVYIQGVKIGAFCIYCLISAAAAFLLFVIASWFLRASRKNN